jgi:hypothetical protein
MTLAKNTIPSLSNGSWIANDGRRRGPLSLPGPPASEAGMSATD